MIDLKRLRKEKGITQKELAQLLSCGQSFIANVENGRRDLPPVKIEILERKFGNICSYITNDVEEIKPIENKPKTIAPKQHSQTEKMEVSTDILFAGADAFSRQLIQLMNEKLIAPYSMITEKEKEIERLNREIGHLEALLEVSKKMNAQQEDVAKCADAV